MEGYHWCEIWMKKEVGAPMMLERGMLWIYGKKLKREHSS